MIAFLVSLLLVGFVVGLLARFLVPGRDPMGCLGTAVLGILGSLVGGLLADALLGPPGRDVVLRPAGLIGSVLGAMLLLVLLRLPRGPQR
jgi:uncharacterized membrane protein YeaQ/YmgE (transglycosylase-associated protein family)